MKYFQHDLLAREDDKIWELIDRHGVTGYGAWWIILEELYKAEDDGFKVEATETWLKRLSKTLGMSDYRTFPRLLDTFAELNLINSQLWQEHIIFSNSVVARGDYYVRKKSLARERKQKERAIKKERAEATAAQLHKERLERLNPSLCHASVTRDIEDVTEDGAVTSRTNTYTDPDSYSNSDSDSDSEDLDLERDAPQEKPAKSVPCEIATEAQITIPATSQTSELAPTGKSKKLKARSGSSKKLNEATIDELGLHYNTVRPELWSNFSPTLTASKDRLRLFGYLWDYAGQDMARAKEVIDRGMAFAKCDPFFSGVGKGSGGTGLNRPGIRFFLEKSRYEDWETRCPADPEKIHGSPLTDVQLQGAKAQHQEKQAATADPAVAKLKALGIL